MPSSSSHALIGGLIGAGVVKGGTQVLVWMGITKLRPIGGFCAETAAAISIIGASLAGIPVSTTHTITGAIVGVGSTIRLRAYRWGVAGTIIWAWVLTIPVSAFLSALLYFVLRPLFQ